VGPLVVVDVVHLQVAEALPLAARVDPAVQPLDRAVQARPLDPLRHLVDLTPLLPVPTA
jgi:hypothetical protein